MLSHELLVIVKEVLSRRANGYETRADTIYNGKIIAEELRSNLKEIMRRIDNAQS